VSPESPASDAAVPSVASFRVMEVREGLIVLAVPGTDYQLHLALDGSVDAAPGKRVRGEIFAEALRMHRSDRGGQFIEPVYGEPRIVQGFVERVDPQRNRVLLLMPVPVWVTLHELNDIDDFAPGEMWNCYVESGTRFVPAGG